MLDDRSLFAVKVHPDCNGIPGFFNDGAGLSIGEITTAIKPLDAEDLVSMQLEAFDYFANEGAAAFRASVVDMANESWLDIPSSDTRTLLMVTDLTLENIALWTRSFKHITRLTIDSTIGVAHSLRVGHQTLIDLSGKEGSGGIGYPSLQGIKPDTFSMLAKKTLSSEKDNYMIQQLIKYVGELGITHSFVEDVIGQARERNQQLY